MLASATVKRGYNIVTTTLRRLLREAVLVALSAHPLTYRTPETAPRLTAEPLLRPATANEAASATEATLTLPKPAEEVASC